MGKILKNKKVVLALVTLVVTVVAVGLNVDLGAGTASAVTDVICQVITCS